MRLTVIAATFLIAPLFGCQSQKTDVSTPLVVPQSVEIHGHRGARGLRPENTLPSFEIALDLEVDYLELDLHYTADGKLAVWHDPYIFSEHCRSTSEREPGWSLSRPKPPAHPLRADVVDPDIVPMLHPALAIRNQRADQLRKLACDRNPFPKRYPQQRADPGELAGDDYGLVTLDEVLDFVRRYAESREKTESQRENARNVRFNIETKRSEEYPTLIADMFDGDSPGPFETELHRVLTTHDVSDRTVVQSFDHRSLWAIRKLDPDLSLSALERESDERPGERELTVSFAELKERGASIWSPDHDIVTAESLEAAHAAGLRVVPWTINDTKEMGRLVELGVDGIITDRPDLISH